MSGRTELEGYRSITSRGEMNMKASERNIRV